MNYVAILPLRGGSKSIPLKNIKDIVSHYVDNGETYHYEESEEDKIVRLAREKAIERNKRIDSILG